MFSSPFLPLPTGLEIAAVNLREDLLVVQVVSTKARSCCPLCFCSAERCHSQYTRVVADLPCAGFRIQLLLHVRRFFCDNAHCARKIFTERLPAFVLPWARLTVRLCEALQSLGFATCGELGTRLAARLAIQTSPTTILRRTMALPLDPVKSVVHLGIDDFALRRGRNYGTVLIDLQHHQVIDLLPDRKAKTAKVWMQLHPEIEVVSRDRAGDYATAACQGAPQAIEAADRFHLIKNLAEAVEKALAPCRAELQKGPKGKEVATSEVQEKSLLSLVTVEGQPYSAHQAERYDRYQQAMALRKQGMIVKEIAKRVGLGRRTIQRWVSEGTYVETNYHHSHRSRFDAYAPYVKQRWESGCHNIQQIWREVQAMGYPHSDSALRAHLEPLRGKVKGDFPEASSLHYSGTSNLISITREKKTAYISRSRCDTIKEPKNLLQRVHQKRGMYVVFSPYHTGGSRTISAGERNMASRVVLLASTPGFLFCSPRTLSPCTAVSASGDERDPPQKQLADRRTRQAGSPLWHATFALASRLG